MKYFIVTGEPSGELYGAMLANALKQRDKKADIRGVGGDKMQQAGVHLVTHIKEISFMGLWQVFTNFWTLVKLYQTCKRDVVLHKPDVVVLIDYGGFNLRFARWAKKNDCKVVYYIPPKVWAWKEKRILRIKKYVDKVLLIFPFEKNIYTKYNIPFEYVGNPQVEYMERQQHIPFDINNSNLIALMPGSREQEIRKILPIMIGVAEKFPTYQFVIIKAASIQDEFYERIISKSTKVQNLHSVRNIEQAVFKKTAVAIVKSGTSTLQVALAHVPQIVCYKASIFNYFIFSRFIKVKFISLPNLIMEKEIVKELLQSECTIYHISTQLQELLNEIKNKQFYDLIMNNYKSLRKKLVSQQAETPSLFASKIIMELASQE